MSNQSEQTKGVLALVLTTILWSSGGLFIKMLPNLSAIAINGLRSAISAVIILLVMRRKPKINLTIILAGVSLALVSIFFIMANKLTTSANAIIMQETSPIFVLLVTSIMARKLPSKKQVIVILITFLGTAMVFADQISYEGFLGNCYGVLAGVFFAGVFLINKQKNASPIDSSFWGVVIGGIVGIPSYLTMNFETSYIFPVLWLGVVQFGLAYACFSYAIKRCDPVVASVVAIFEAILNPLWVAIFFGELPGTIGIIGFFVVIIGIVLCVTTNEKTSFSTF